MKIKYLFLVAAIINTSNAFPSDVWVKLTEVTDMTFEIKVGSIERKTIVKSNQEVISFIMRTRNKKTKKIEFEKDYVRIDDCNAGYGTIVTTNLTGIEKYSNEFVINGENIASLIAETLCDLIKDTEDDSPDGFASHPPTSKTQ